MYNKKISIEIAVGIIVLIVLAFGGYVFFETRKVEAPIGISNVKMTKEECEKKYAGKECNLTLENGWQPINPNNLPEGNNQNVEIANPASVYCEQNGGKTEIVTAADGSQSGNCILADGTKCEEWTFMRGECNIDGLKIYRDQDLGYQFQIPVGWEVEKTGNNQDPSSYNVTIKQKNEMDKNNIQIVNVASGYGTNADGTINNREQELKRLSDGKYEKISILGGEEYYYIADTLGGPAPKAYIVSDKEIILVSYEVYKNSLAEAEKFFKQFLSTFKFTN